MRTRLLPLLDRLYRYALSLSRNDDVARDLVQEACARALAAARVPEDETAFRVWLFRIARNTHIDWVRALRPGTVAIEEVDEYVRHDPWEREAMETDRLLLAKAFRQLADSQREILTLVDIIGLSYKEAAQVLDVPDGTVMSRVARARASLLNAISTGDVVPFRQRKSR